MKKIFGIAVSLFLKLAAVGVANAALLFEPTKQGLAAQNTLTGVVIFSLCRITFGIFSVLMVISVIMVLWAAYNYLTSSGDEEKVKKATRTITYAAVAIVVALIASGFPNIVASFTGTPLGAGCSIWSGL